MPLNREKTQSLFQRALEVMPRGVSSGIRYFGVEETVVADHASGPYLYDPDGNQYIDYRLGFGPVILGHAHPEVTKRVQQAIEDGITYALTNKYEVEAAEKIVEMCPCVETLRFANSGAESTQHALRVARAHSGREQIIKFEGQYHGMYDYMMFSTFTDPSGFGYRRNPIPDPLGSGIPDVVRQLVITLPYNDFEMLDLTLRRAWHEVAAIIVEPIMGNCAAIEPEPGWLQLIREKCNEYGIVMIMDEVKTGFRVANGGAQELYGVIPDLVCYAKALGNGFPVAAFGGKREIMEALTGGVAHGGTFNGNVVATAAASAVLDILQKEPVLTTAAARGRMLQDGLQEVFDRAGVPLRMAGHPSMFGMMITEEEVKDCRGWAQTNHTLYGKLVVELQTRGILVERDTREPWFLSAAHSEEDIAKTVDIVEACLKTILA